MTERIFQEMNRLKHFVYSRVAVAAVVFAAFGVSDSAAQIQLPVTVVNGRECFYYKPTSSTETVYGLSKRLGLTREEIVAYNPSVADGIHKNTTLYFPVSDFRDRIYPENTSNEKGDAATTGNRTADNAKNDSSENTQASVPAKENYRKVEPYQPSERLRPVKPEFVSEPSEDSGDKAAGEESLAPYSIAVLLPFKLEEPEMQRPAKLATDFYKGLMIAADTLSRRGETVEIRAFDTRGEASEVKRLLALPEVSGASVIIAPESTDFIAQAIGINPEAYIVNAQNFADSLFMTHPKVVQTNIPQRMMYSKAITGFIENLGGAKPVIISNSEGRNDKEAFVALLSERLAAEGIAPVTISYEGTLGSSDLEQLDTTPGASYAIIPSAGSIHEFNRFSHALNNFRVANPEVRIVLLGYPEWISYRGDAQDMLHTLGAIIYSRFNDDYDSFGARTINEDFLRWYGAQMLESIPSQGLLGYDLGCMLIKNIRANKGRFNPSHPATYEGIQTTYRLRRASESDEDAGWYNDALYIIRYLPVTGTESKIL